MNNFINRLLGTLKTGGVINKHVDYTCNDDRGFIVQFNNILYRYVNTFLNKNTGKIYKKLLEGYVNGYSQKDLSSNLAINDRVSVIVPTGSRTYVVTDSLKSLKTPEETAKTTKIGTTKLVFES
jgi:hypothetical protein